MIRIAVEEKSYLDHQSGEIITRDCAMKRGLVDDEEEFTQNINLSITASKYQKPKRPCPYCHTMQCHLRRHVLLRHKDHEDVKSLLCLPKPEQKLRFDLMRKRGIHDENKKRLKENPAEQNNLIVERSHGRSEFQMCSACLGFYQRSKMWHHKLHCDSTGTGESALSVPIEMLSTSRPSSSNMDEFSQKILHRFRGDEAGKICKSDDMIKIVGKIIWERSSKQDGRSTMGEMRRLGTLLLFCRRLSNNDKMSGHELFDPKNFKLVVDSMNTLTAKEDEGLKGGLRLGIGYVLKKAARFTKSEFIINGQDDEVRKRENFLALLHSSWGHLFNRAECQMESNREISLRRPGNLPIEEDVEILRDYVELRINQLVEDQLLFWTSDEFIELRSLLVCRLTLYNGRRGGEPARLLLQEWIDADNSTWITPAMIETIVDPVEKALVGKFRLAYQRGKGSRKMVPILIPLSAVSGIQKLVDKRSSCNISTNNPYLFATVKSVDGHATGCQAIKATALKAGIINPSKLTATKMRHRASTIYALQDVSDQERKAFYKHMGHSQAINETVYQCPSSLIEISKVGGFLHQLDSGHLTGSVSSSASGLKTSTSNDMVLQNVANITDKHDLSMDISIARAVIHTQDTDEEREFFPEDVIANSQPQRSNNIAPGLKGNSSSYYITLEAHRFDFLNLLICSFNTEYIQY